MEREDVLAMFADGVQAVRGAAAGWTCEDWARPACGHWTANDLAGHLLCMTRWHHAWLDRAESGDASRPWPIEERDERNDKGRVGLRPASGPERIALFVEEAERYAERLDSSSWALAYGFPHGTVPAGAHAVIASVEWHLHAWDLSGGAHRPADPRGLLVGGCRVMAATRPGPTARLTAGVSARLSARRQPWERLLLLSGRTPAPPAAG
jgi:hypothetical protein